MKLLAGAIAYLFFVASVVVAAFAGLSLIERRAPEEPAVAARPADDRAARRARALDEAKRDPNRVPVWIAATAKYEYTPVPVEPPKHRTITIGKDARGAMAKAPPRTRPRPDQRDAANADVAPRMLHSRRDNDPFFRD